MKPANTPASSPPHPKPKPQTPASKTTDIPTLSTVLHIVPQALNAATSRLPPSIERDDLRAIGYLTLVKIFPRAPFPKGKKAVLRFLFTSITNAIYDELRKNDPLGRRTRQILKKLKATQGRTDCIQELKKTADAAGVPFAAAKTALKKEETFLNSSHKTIPDIPDSHPNPREELENKEIKTNILNLVNNLKPNEKFVVTHTILENNTLKDAAKKTGLTAARIHQIQKASLLHLHPKIHKLIHGNSD